MKLDENTTFKIGKTTYNIKQLSVLQNFKKENLRSKPYDYLVIEEALPKEIYDYLSKHYPKDNDIFKEDQIYRLETQIEELEENLKINKKEKKDIEREIKKKKMNIESLINNKHNMESNIRYDLPSIKKDKFTFLDPIWILFINYHNSRLFVEEVRNIFGKKFDEFYNIKYKIETTEKLKCFDDMIVDVRKKNLVQEADFVTDTQIGINSPCKEDSYVKGPHYDNLNEVYAGLFYLKQENDKTEGGNLKIFDVNYKYKNLLEFQEKITPLKDTSYEFQGRTYRRRNEFDRKDLKLVEQVKYKANVFVLFLNEINAIHGISIRKKGNVSRRLINIIGECYFHRGRGPRLRTPKWFERKYDVKL